MKVCRDGNDLVLLVPAEYAHSNFPDGLYEVLEWLSYYALESENPRRKGRAPIFENGVDSECDWEFTDYAAAGVMTYDSTTLPPRILSGVIYF